MSRGALYSIVSTDVLSTGTSHIAGDLTTSHDHVLLVDHSGQPCAVAVENWNDRDVQYEYLDGGLSQNREEISHEITINCKNLTNDARRKLDKMARSRQNVMFTPGFGPRTEFAYRPLRWLKTQERDLTGKHVMTAAGSSNSGFIWDGINGAGTPLSPTSAVNKPRLVRTPCGAGQVFERGYTNLAYPDAPSYPAGAGGWTAAGAGVTQTIISNGFGATQAPDSVKFEKSGITSAYFISKFTTLSSTSASSVDVVVYVRGKVTHKTSMLAYGDLPSGAAKDLSNMDLSSWTPIRLRVHSSGTSSFYILFSLETTGGAQESFSLEIGPVVVTQFVSASHLGHRVSEWAPTGAARIADYITTTTNVKWPGEGSVFTAFHVPSEFDDTKTYHCGINHSPAFTHAGKVQILNYDSAPYTRASFYTSDSNIVAAAMTLLRGRVNTVCATWTRGLAKLYANGVQVDSRTSNNIALPDTPIRLGTSDLTGSAISPFLLNQFRIDGGVWDADRVMSEHFTASEPVASAPIVSARGRTYYIESIPSIPVVSGSGTFWSGSIVLRQVKYSRPMSDICTCEGDYR